MSQTEACSFLIQQLIQAKNLPEEEKRQQLKTSFEFISKNYMTKLEEKMVGTYYLGYISLVDFFLYEMMYFTLKVFPEKVDSFPKIFATYQAIS